MTSTQIDPTTGDLVVAGRRVFPLGLSDPPPVVGTAPNSGLPAWTEIATAGVTHVRNYTVWNPGAIAEQLFAVGQELDAAQREGSKSGLDSPASTETSCESHWSTRSSTRSKDIKASAQADPRAAAIR